MVDIAGRILVLGGLNLDFVLRAQRLPVAGETVTGGEYVQVFGGKGANTATAAARAGGQVTFMICLSNDYFGRRMVENFQSDEMDTSSIQFLDDQLSVEMMRKIENLISDSALVLLQIEIPTASNREVLRVAAPNV